MVKTFSLLISFLRRGWCDMPFFRFPANYLCEFSLRFLSNQTLLRNVTWLLLAKKKLKDIPNKSWMTYKWVQISESWEKILLQCSWHPIFFILTVRLIYTIRFHAAKLSRCTVISETIIVPGGGLTLYLREDISLLVHWSYWWKRPSQHVELQLVRCAR